MKSITTGEPGRPTCRVMSHHTQCLLSNPKPKVTRISPPIFPKHSGRCSSEDFCSWKNKNSDHQRLCSRCCNSHFLSSPLDKKLAASVPKINVKTKWVIGFRSNKLSNATVIHSFLLRYQGCELYLVISLSAFRWMLPISLARTLWWGSSIFGALQKKRDQVPSVSGRPSIQVGNPKKHSKVSDQKIYLYTFYFYKVGDIFDFR